jgi:hypothetical protein
MKKMQWPVLITEVDNGYQLEVGCRKLVFERQETMMAELMAYMNGKKTNLSKELKKDMQTEGLLGTQACVPQAVRPAVEPNF